jgi:hypothetical protein
MVENRGIDNQCIAQNKQKKNVTLSVTLSFYSGDGGSEIKN